MKSLKTVAGFVGVVMCLLAANAGADTVRITAFIERTLVTGDSVYGGCMVRLSTAPADVLPSCKGPWVSFSCDGTYTDPVRAYRMLDQAQLALATGMTVQVIVDDSRKHNGYCYASRIDVLSP